MIKRSLFAGVLVGAALVLVAAYPLLSVVLGPRVLSVRWPAGVRLTLLIVSGALGLVVVILVGSLAAWRSGATEAGQGFKAGAISGLVVSTMFYAILLAPTAAASASLRLWAHLPTRQAPYPPTPMLLAFIQQMARIAYLRLGLCLLAGGLLGGIEGAFVGWRRRREPVRRGPLLDLIEAPRARRRWFADNDDTWRAGIAGGLIGGMVIWVGIATAFFAGLQVEWPVLQSLVRESSDSIAGVLFSEKLLNFLYPLFLLAALGTAALTVLLLGDPPRRHLSRFHAVLIAAVTTTLPIFTAVLQMSYLGVGISRYLAWYLAHQGQTANPQGEIFVAPRVLQFLQQFVRSPETVLFLFYLLPFVLFAVLLIGILVWLAPQAVFYGLTLPLVFRRPVDRAARVARAINSQPSCFLPQIYRLYGQDARAVQVLPHLAFLLRDRTAARVTAAYHALSTEPGMTQRAMALIRQTVSEQEIWRWRVEVRELHRVLGDGLAAKTLAQVTAIEPPPQEVTSSLPILLARSCEGIGRVLGELKKVQRVDDLSTKLIFLNSAQAALLDLNRCTSRHSELFEACETPYPELAILHLLLDRWQGLVLSATQDLQGRADLRAELKAHRAGFTPRVRQCIVVTNQGLNVAQNVHLSLIDGQGYQIVEGSEQDIEILCPQESRELEFWLVAERPGRLRLAWRLTFDDAVDTGRRVEFADAMELVQEETARPFQRIFPIPYVTGTPLRSGEMFVGRQDIFDFVREHLLGAYQNNVIVLHGQRRTGKTSILYRLQEVLADTHVAVLVDMQGKAARGTADFLYALSDDISYTLEVHGMAVDLPARSDYGESPEFTFRSRFLRSVVHSLDNRNLLLMFDEFEELQKRVEDGRLEPEIFSFLRNLMQHEPRLDFVFSGTHKLEELGAEYWSILFNIAAYKHITFLDADEVRRLVTEPVAPFGLEYDPLAVDRIGQVTAGHPYFAQVVCHEMVAYHNESQRNYLTVTCVDEVLERIIERGEAHFKYIWAGAQPEEQKVMLALADLLPDADAAATPAQLADELVKRGHEISTDALSHTLAQLQAKDILTRSGPQSSLYRFKIDLIRRWIGITRPTL